jgi:flavin-dependent dehydrogenase
MGDRSRRKLAIVGDGPAGTTLATLLARDGMRVVLFARGRPAGLVVGESLIPALTPILRELGVEDEVRSYGVLKPGATFVQRDGETVAFRFADFAGRVPGYAYNVARDRFDATLLEAVRRSGAQVLPTPARLEADPDAPGRVRLSGESAAQARDLLGGDPDLIVDATGRANALARLLGLPVEEGDRRDFALFAHCEGVPLDNAGHVHMDHLERGWCWRIPVGGDRVSLGIVVSPEVVSGFGRDAEAQFESMLAADPRLKQLWAHARRVSPVLRYSNYQRTTLRGVGPGWALVGDAFGFVDPIFSSGLLLAMDGARALAAAVRSGSPGAYRRYQQRQLLHFDAWRRLVSYYYDGRIFELIRLGHPEQANWIGRLVNPHVSKRVSRILTGESTTARYSRWLLGFMIAQGLRGRGPSDLRVR